MKKNLIQNAIFTLFFVAAACTTVNEIKALQTQLREKAKTEGAIANSDAAVTDTKSPCQAVMLNQEVVIEITDKDPLVIQNKESNLFGHFKKLCVNFPDTTKYVIDVSSQNKGGGMGKSFYFIPKISLYSKKLQKEEVKALPGKVQPRV